MTFAEMRAEVLRRLAQGSPQVAWTTDEIDTALNDGYLELSDASEWNEEYLDIDLLQDRPYYDLRTIVGCGFLAPGAAFDRQTNRWLLPTAVRQFDAHDRRWERVTGEPQRILTRGLWWVGYWPRLQSEVGSVKQYYTSLPKRLCLDDDEPGFPEVYHEGCVDFAMVELWAQDGETTLALLAAAKYQQVENDLVSWVNERASDALVHGYGSVGAEAS